MIRIVKQITLALSVLLVLGGLTVPAAASASVFDSTSEACDKAGNKPAACVDKGGGDPLTGNDGLIIKVANIVSAIAGVAAVIIIILAGLRFITANGDASQIAGARSTILYVVIGLIIIATSRLILGLVVSGLR